MLPKLYKETPMVIDEITSIIRDLNGDDRQAALVWYPQNDLRKAENARSYVFGILVIMLTFDLHGRMRIPDGEIDGPYDLLVKSLELHKNLLRHLTGLRGLSQEIIHRFIVLSLGSLRLWARFEEEYRTQETQCSLTSEKLIHDVIESFTDLATVENCIISYAQDPHSMVKHELELFHHLCLQVSLSAFHTKDHPSIVRLQKLASIVNSGFSGSGLTDEHSDKAFVRFLEPRNPVQTGYWLMTDRTSWIVKEDGSLSDGAGNNDPTIFPCLRQRKSFTAVQAFHNPTHHISFAYHQSLSGAANFFRNYRAVIQTFRLNDLKHALNSDTLAPKTLPTDRHRVDLASILMVRFLCAKEIQLVSQQRLPRLFISAIITVYDLIIDFASIQTSIKIDEQGLTQMIYSLFSTEAINKAYIKAGPLEENTEAIDLFNYLVGKKDSFISHFFPIEVGDGLESEHIPFWQFLIKMNIKTVLHAVLKQHGTEPTLTASEIRQQLAQDPVVELNPVFVEDDLEFLAKRGFISRSPGNLADRFLLDWYVARRLPRLWFSNKHVQEICTPGSVISRCLDSTDSCYSDISYKLWWPQSSLIINTGTSLVEFAAAFLVRFVAFICGDALLIPQAISGPLVELELSTKILKYALETGATEEDSHVFTILLMGSITLQRDCNETCDAHSQIDPMVLTLLMNNLNEGSMIKEAITCPSRGEEKPLSTPRLIGEALEMFYRASMPDEWYRKTLVPEAMLFASLIQAGLSGKDMSKEQSRKLNAEDKLKVFFSKEKEYWRAKCAKTQFFQRQETSLASSQESVVIFRNRWQKYVKDRVFPALLNCNQAAKYRSSGHWSSRSIKFVPLPNLIQSLGPDGRYPLLALVLGNYCAVIHMQILVEGRLIPSLECKDDHMRLRLIYSLLENFQTSLSDRKRAETKNYLMCLVVAVLITAYDLTDSLNHSIKSHETLNLADLIMDRFLPHHISKALVNTSDISAASNKVELFDALFAENKGLVMRLLKTPAYHTSPNHVDSQDMLSWLGPLRDAVGRVSHFLLG